jgi:hypothetical protein
MSPPKVSCDPRHHPPERDCVVIALLVVAVWFWLILAVLDHPKDHKTALVSWHFGKKIVPDGKKKPFWMNRWLAHPCADLALPFELGIRARNHTDAA